MQLTDISQKIIIVLAVLTHSTGSACTTAVVSGRVTNDGRPLLWKNRDFSQQHNEVIRLTGGTHKAIGVANAGSRTSVWMGVNEAGFCIENSLSLDLNSKTTTKGPGNGVLMRRALETCATLDDFSELLQTTELTGRVTCGNFGVIDANGGAAIFEVGRTFHRMFDANDPHVAPNGYIVRSNFSITGQDLPILPSNTELANVASGRRYLRAYSLLESQGVGNISAEFLIRNCARDMADVDGVCISGSVNSDHSVLPRQIATAETISRATTVSATVFHGVRADEDPNLTTMLTILGDPKFSIAVPCWADSPVIPEELKDKHGGEIGEIALTLRDWGFSDSRTKTISASYLSGIWQGLWRIEDEILRDARQLKQASSTVSTRAEFSHASAKKAMAAMKNELQETKTQALLIDPSIAPTFAENFSEPLAR